MDLLHPHLWSLKSWNPLKQIASNGKCILNCSAECLTVAKLLKLQSRERPCLCLLAHVVCHMGGGMLIDIPSTRLDLLATQLASKTSSVLTDAEINHSCDARSILNHVIGLYILHLDICLHLDVLEKLF